MGDNPGSIVKRFLARACSTVVLCSAMQGGIAGPCPHLPAKLPLDSVATGNTCPPDPNPPCNDIVYESPAAATRFVLEQPGSIRIWLTPGFPPIFDPQGFLFSDRCPGGTCAPGAVLPAGSYCLTVTASNFDPVGACGCFEMLTVVSIFMDGFEATP